MSAAARSLPAALAGALDRELACTEALLEVLDAERRALAEADAESLQDACARKQRALEALAAQSRERERLARGSAPDPSDANWQRLLAAAERCRDRNLANAALLDAQRVRVLWSLRALGVGGSTYARDGLARAESARRVLATG